jgi:hypothetical protein
MGLLILDERARERSFTVSSSSRGGAVGVCCQMKQ